MSDILSSASQKEESNRRVQTLTADWAAFSTTRTFSGTRVILQYTSEWTALLQLSAHGKFFTFSIHLVRHTQKANVLFGSVSDVVHVKFPLGSSESAWTTCRQRIWGLWASVPVNWPDPIHQWTCDVRMNMTFLLESSASVFSSLLDLPPASKRSYILQVDSVADEIRPNCDYILFYWIHGHHGILEI